MKKIIAFLSMFLSLLPVYGKSSNQGTVKADYDERVELMSILCHLAGFQEYNMNLGGSYITDIDDYFASVKAHPAIAMMDSLHSYNGVGFDSPMSFAIHLTKNGNEFCLVNDTIVPERRWRGVDLKKVTATINDFYRESRFSEFYESHRAFYEEICDIFNRDVLSRFNHGWYESFYGVPPTDNFSIIIGFANGGGNYGPSRSLPGKPRDVYAIIGFAYDENGTPYYSSDPEMYLGTLVHEFNHSFVNHLTEDQRFAAQMEQAAKAMMPYSAKVMRRNAYSSWQNLVNESIVRASVIIYLIDNNTAKDKIRQSIVDEMSTGFYWTPELVKRLKHYSKHRDKYPSIDSYYPVLIDFFYNYADSRASEVDSVLCD